MSNVVVERNACSRTGQTPDGQQSAAELEEEGIYSGVGVVIPVGLVLGGKEPSGARGQRSLACTQQLS